MHTPKTVTVVAKAEKEAQIGVRLDTPDGKEIACIAIGKGETEKTASLKDSVTGKHAVYFVFETGAGQVEFDRFTFDD